MNPNEIINIIKEINSLIYKLDKDQDYSNHYSFKAIREHINEIEELFSKKDSHWSAETVDLIIHSLLLLERNNCDEGTIQRVFKLRLDKFKDKITSKLKK